MATLAKIDISVPPRTNGRTTKHTEKWTICRWLASIAEADKLDYPAQLIHRDRPDFELESGMVTSGIEVSEVIPRDLAHAEALVEQEDGDTFIELCHFRPGHEPMDRNDLSRLVKNNKLTGNGWSGSEMEQDWVQFILSALCAKIQKVQDPKFQWFDRNILLLYDNTPCIGLKEAVAVQNLSARLPGHIEEKRLFSDLAILRSECVLVVNAISTWSRLPTPELWGAI